VNVFPSLGDTSWHVGLPGHWRPRSSSTWSGPVAPMLIAAALETGETRGGG